MKKTLLSLIALFITVIAFAYDAQIDGIYYNLNTATKTAEVTYDGSPYDGADYFQTEITIPSSITYEGHTYSVTSIGEYAFSDCSSLTSITIPNSVSSIGGGAFDNTPWLNNQPDGCIYINNCLYKYKGIMPQNAHIEVKEGTTLICGAAFFNCSALTSITIPNSVTSIGNSAFFYCSALTSITIPNNVTYIGSYAFHDTPWLNNQPNGCVYINNLLYTYKGEMPENTHIDVKEGTTQICSDAFANCTSLSSITIPNSVTSIGNSAFFYCSSLTSITIPNSVTFISNGAFYDCSSLTSITIPNNVTSIGEVAFFNCSALTSITIPNSVTSIGNSAFSFCSSLTSITIPNSVTEIGYYTFEYCTSLTSITSPAIIFNEDTGSSKLQEIHVIAGKLNESGFNFINQSKKTLHTIDLAGATNTTINDLAFYDYYKLENLTLPTNVETIGYKSFADCVKLKSISFPASLKSIDDLAFANCTNIDTIQVDAIIPPTITATSFDKVSRDIEFIVPASSRNAYAEHEYWKEFIQEVPVNIENNIFENTEIFTQNGTLHIEGIESDYQIYNTSGQLIYSGNAATLTLSRGIYLVTIEGKTKKIVL